MSNKKNVAAEDLGGERRARRSAPYLETPAAAVGAAENHASTSVAETFYELRGMHDDDLQELAAVIRQETPGLPLGWDLSIAGTVLDHGHLRGSHDKGQKQGNGGINPYLIDRAFLILDRYVAKGGDAFMATRCVRLLLGFNQSAGVDDLNGLVKLVGQKKQTVNKCLKYFQELMPELDLLPGQRGYEARKKMATARKEQIQPVGEGLTTEPVTGDNN